jgi:hypothetical protein
LLGIYGTIWIDFLLVAVVIFDIWTESLIKLMVLEVPDTIPQYPHAQKIGFGDKHRVDSQSYVWTATDLTAEDCFVV